MGDAGDGRPAPGEEPAVAGEGRDAAGEGHGAAAGGHAAGAGPVARDWPRGSGEASWWPVTVAVGAAGLYLGAGLTAVGRTVPGRLGPLVGPAVLAGGAAVLVAGLAGWTVQGFVAGYGERRGPSTRRRFRWGTAAFLAAEAATFGGVFTYYFYVRSGPWPREPLPGELLSTVVLANTAVLVTSSVTVHLAGRALERGRRRRFLALLGATVALGVAFLAGQALEYLTFVREEGLTPDGGVFASAFYGLTGLHGFHVAVGVVLLSVALARALAGNFTAERHVGVSMTSRYWHFVDGVWLVLVTTLYVGATLRL